MEPVNTFCLAAILFLSLPLPLFASAALGTYPSARRSLMRWVWANLISLSAIGLLIIGTPLPSLAGLAMGSVIFLFCGMQMLFWLARFAVSLRDEQREAAPLRGRRT